ncbi:MAG TPA: ATP-dependent DNA helicase RecG [Candidatus Woesebacteria bacterium]|nr:ATP-dependent DNA helicase RecG [Candidatus Woesebacteria bacterium]
MSTAYFPDDPITAVRGIGPSISAKLNKLGIETIRDLLHHFPSRYLDFSNPVPINELRIGQTQTFTAKLTEPKVFYTKNGRLICQSTAEDSSGKIVLTWFNNPYIKRVIKGGDIYTIAGKTSFWGAQGKTIISPVVESGHKPSINTRGLVPVFPQTAGITSRWLRSKIYEILPSLSLNDPLDQDLIQRLDLIDLYQAYQEIHFPKSKNNQLLADKRLSFNEHLSINIKNQLELHNLGKSVSLCISSKITQETSSCLPFTLTKDQEKTITSLYHDLRQDTFTHRLIQGDTGSGKTATLLFAANQCIAQNKSCAIMAPTEILANQHYQTFKKYSLFPDNIQLITGSSGNKIDISKPSIYIGTHALISAIPATLKTPLAFVAIDEQHKFGVKQRDELLRRTPVPHLVNLSATPIPRTVALGLLGDIEISSIIHKPLNRLPTKTFVTTPTHFKKSPEWLAQKLNEGNQIFVVCPNITEHDTNTASVEKISAFYRRITPPQYPVYVVHGKMKVNDQNKVLADFKNSEKGVLVATTLIEVGIDIPNANVMIVHSAERFGLATLHQLRGRVGRGEGQGFCFLVPSTDDEEETERLQLLQKYHSGLTLAQKDLRLRGAGEVFGFKQHGSLPTSLKYFWSKKLFLEAKKLASSLVKSNIAQAEEIATKLSTC